MTDPNWCAEHKRDRPCEVCETLNEAARKMAEMTPDERRALLAPHPAEPEDDTPENEPAEVEIEARDKRLDTGMKIGEAIDRAMLWWENKGRRLMREVRLEGPGVGFMALDPRDPAVGMNSIPSGILQGKPWVDLTKAERAHVVKVWHHQHVRVPDLAVAPLTQH